MIALDTALALCKRFEGLYLAPYLCPAGVPTIGYGATFYEDGRRVLLTDPRITPERAEAMLRQSLTRHFLPKVTKACPNVPDSPALGALLDFAFNVGHGALLASTLRKRVNAGDWGGVELEIMKWNKAGGRVLLGLTRRREAEKKLLTAHF